MALSLASSRAAALRLASAAPSSARRASTTLARAQVNPDIKKDVDKVVDMAKVDELPKPKAVICRCWRSKAFPYCDGAHVKHNKETQDNVGPFVIDTSK